jgi:hypothetical protein
MPLVARAVVLVMRGFDTPDPNGEHRAAAAARDPRVVFTRGWRVPLGHARPQWIFPTAGGSPSTELPSTYRYANGVLTQKVNTAGAAFPVVADPSYSTGMYLELTLAPYWIPYFAVTYTRAECAGCTISATISASLLG